MSDVSLEWNGDFAVSPTGGLLLASGDDYARQRIIRRLFTNLTSYIWHLDYGAGLPAKVGQPMRVTTIQSIVASQIALEASVAANPPAKVSVSNDPATPNLFIIDIVYTAAATGEPVNLTFTV